MRQQGSACVHPRSPSRLRSTTTAGPASAAGTLGSSQPSVLGGLSATAVLPSRPVIGESTRSEPQSGDGWRASLRYPPKMPSGHLTSTAMSKRRKMIKKRNRKTPPARHQRAFPPSPAMNA